MSQIPPETRKIILEEIKKWQQDGLITDSVARDLARRYEPASAKPTAPEAASPAAPLAPAPAVPPTPRPNLTQTLLSETSIKIALYLGAFFVIAAALILAALVEVLRLPILLVVTTIFGGAALALKKRLPQPSFILFLVFSALLPISAGVISDLLNLKGQTASAFWMVVLSFMALVWAVSTWLYVSRFFSAAAFGALAVAAWFFADLFDPQTELYLLALSAVGMLAILGAGLLKRWQGQKFALPLFWLAQAYQITILAAASFTVVYYLFEDVSLGWWLFSGAICLAGALFYILSDLIIPFALFPFLAVGSLALFPWVILNEFEPARVVYALVGWFWALLLAASGEIAGLLGHPKARQYALPLTLACLPLFFLAALWELPNDISLGFGLFAVTGLVLTLLQVRRARWWVWAAGVLAWLIAYFSFFGLPFIKFEPEELYILAGAAALLLLPDLALIPNFKHAPAWRWPPRVFNLLVISITTLGALVEGADSPEKAAITFGIFTALALAFALRFNQPVLGLLFIGYATLFVVYILRPFDLDLWLPALTGLVVIFYALGLGLAKRSGDWSALFRWSSLTLGLFISLLAISFNGKGQGWYVAVIGLLFVIETFGRFPLLEILVEGVYTLAFSLILYEAKGQGLHAYLVGISIILLGLDVLFARTLAGRGPWKWLPRQLGGLVALGGNLMLLTQWREAGATQVAISVTYALLFLAYALLYRQPRLGFVYFAALPVTVLTAAGFAGLTRWSGVLILLGLLYYALGFLDKPRGWGVIRRLSGLALGTLVAVSIPFEGSGLWASIPVAIAATLWAVEAFRRRNVWLGFPTNLLYLLAYFMILVELRVDEPQFFSVGAALLGMLMHYLLLRSGSNTGAFVTGMVSQLALLSTTYIQMASTNQLGFFAALFFQSLAVLIYGLVIRSRSLTFTPIAFVVLGVVTVVFSVLKGISTVILIGCTGILMILLGILAVVMRERIAAIGERMSDWKA